MHIDLFSDKTLPLQESFQSSQVLRNTYSQQEPLLKNIPPIGEQRLTDLIEHGNKVIHRLDTRLQWSLHKGSNEMIVKVIDTQTDKVLREIPPEKYLDLVQNLCEQIGLFLDERK